MSDYIVMVEFRLRPGASERFRDLVVENAKASAMTEPGCRRFDVVEPTGERDRILLYEIYSDRAAFDAHLETEHFLRFDAASAALVAQKLVTTGALICEGSE
jgi:(4S)-4-hydroxy-5-phosphonooxypentane-2,3-dione isomerase